MGNNMETHTKSNATPWRMVFDVESISLHGDGFAVGWVVIDPRGHEVEAGLVSCPPENAAGTDEDRSWVEAHVVPALAAPVLQQVYNRPQEVRNEFWQRWHELKLEHPDLELWTDCGWPVEANFLSACVRDDADRTWQGPYPLFDVANILAAAGEDPIGTYGRLPSEEPAHNPLCDARQSARVLAMALGKIREVVHA